MKSARLFMLLALGTISAAAQSQSPTLYFTDLTSGPVGAVVTVYGSNLQSSVSVNGVSASVVVSTPQKVSFIVPSTTSGAIRIGESNTLPFTVRPGSIYFVATNGSDSQSGSQSSPWATIPHAFNTAVCGDVIYAMDGVSQTGLDDYGASLSVEQICTQANPLAMVGYPGATVTIGSSTGQEYGIRNPDINNDGFNGMVFANLVIRGNNEALKTVGNEYWRIVGNDFSCPYGGGLSACVLLDASSYVKFLGNSIHDTGVGGTKYYHSLYATTDSNHIEAGWNHIFDNQSCRGIQFYSTGGSPQYDLIVHDNVISGQLCDGINFSTIDPTLGPVEAYNNLVYHVGLGGANLDSPNEACIASLGLGASGGQTLFYGNTFADCGSAGGSTAGAITVQAGAPLAVTMSNLVIQNPGEPVYSPNTDSSLLQSTNDVLLTNGTAGVVDTNYRLVAGSPALGAGVAYAGIMYDLAGSARPQSGSEDAGAYLFSSITVGTGNPTASLSPTSVDFGNQSVNLTSTPRIITLSNGSGSPLSISAVSITGAGTSAFVESNSCGSSVPAGGSCSFSVTFTPASATTYGASLSVADNASGSPQSVALSGTGTNPGLPAVSLTPTSLTFSTPVGTTSAPQVVSLRNSGNADLTISGIRLGGTNASSFVQTNTCGASLASGSTCSISVTFSATSASSSTASFIVTDNAPGSPQTVSLTGSGTDSGSPNVALTPSSLTLSGIAGTTSAPQSITLLNSGTATLSLTGITIGGSGAASFAQTNTCGTTLATGANCRISVTFTPSAATSFAATLNVTDNAQGSPQTVTLTGVGSAAADFTLTASPNSQVMQPGGSTTYTIALQSLNGTFTQPVSLTVSGNPAGTVASLSPALIDAASSNHTAVLKVQPTPSAMSQPAPMRWPITIPVVALMLGASRRWVRASWLNKALLALVALLTLASFDGCGYVVNKPGVSATYTLLIIGTSSSTSHSTSVQLTVQ